MSEINPQAANTPMKLGLRIGSLALLMILMLIAAKAAPAQTTMASKSGIMGGDGAVAAQRQTFEDLSNGTGGYLDSNLMQKRMKMLNNERRKSLVSDSDKLLKLATELNDEIAHSNSGTLTPLQLRKVAEIEKLAHSVRDKMTMTIPTPSVTVFPITGPQ